MKKLLPALALVLAASCATNRSQLYAPVRDIAYQAMGAGPFWMVTIGDDRIVLRWTGWDAVHQRTLPRTVDGVITWRAGGDNAAIVIEARPGPCRDRRGQVFEHQVRVSLSGEILDPSGRYAEELTGCGGRLISARRD
jgi:uncharacterized membrane protein